MRLRLSIAGVLLVLLAGTYLLVRHFGAARRPTPIRLVDAKRTDDPRTTGSAVATLNDETRYVLAKPMRHLAILSEWPVPNNARIDVMATLAPEFARVGGVALIAHYRHGTAWTRLPLRTAEVRPGTPFPSVQVVLELPPELAGEKLGFQVEAFALEPDHERRHESDPVAIPSKAYLSFAIGISQAEPSPGATEFAIEACDWIRCTVLFREVLDPLDEDDRGWQDRRVSLNALGGKTRSFVFRSRPAAPSDSAAAFPLWANPTIDADPARKPEQVNVILLSIDTLAAQHLPSYGYPFDTAPFMHRTFGGEGTVFGRALAAATTTPQSHMSMLTGVQPCVHGVVSGMEAAPEWIVTVAEALRHAGYETGAVTEDGWLGYAHGFGRGFNVYAENKSADIMAPDGQVDVTFARAKRWLEVNRDKPFFLFLHTFQVHDPYSPPPRYLDLFTERDGQKVTPESPRPLREMVAYDQEIRYTDDELQKLFADLARLGLAENTVFILTSDHGEEFFQHGHWGHGPTFHEEVTRVPLMLWGPGRIPAGRRVDDLVGHIDLMPTILDLAGVATPGKVMGSSLVPWFGEGEAPPARVRYGESRVDLAIGPDYEVVRVTPPGFLVQRGTRKLARYRRDGGFEYRYYDLADDPAEERSLFPENPAAAADLQTLVDGYEASCASAVNGDQGEQPKLQLDPATEDKLRALGYLK